MRTNIIKRNLLTFVTLAVATVALGGATPAPQRPNIIYILCDDLGYGDVGICTPDGKIPTPNMDRLGREGMVFTDAHSGSAVCSPTRYGVLTGRYAWRSRLKSSVLNGYSDHLIEEGRMTVALLLKDLGCHTACTRQQHKVTF